MASEIIPGGTKAEGKSNILRRSDPRGAAEWLAVNATSPGSLKINGYPSVDFYFRDFDFAYIGPGNHRYWTYSCQRGTVERWGNLPLLTAIADLQQQISRSGHAYIVIDTPSREALLTGLSAWHPRVEWTSRDGYISILTIDPPASGPATE